MYNSLEENLINESLKDFINERKNKGTKQKILKNISDISTSNDCKALCQEIHRDILNIDIESGLELKLSLLFLFVETGIKLRIDYIETTLSRAIVDVTNQIILFKDMRVEYFEPTYNKETNNISSNQVNSQFSPKLIIELYKTKAKEINKYSKKFASIICTNGKVLEDKLILGDINIVENMDLISEDEELVIKDLDTFLEYAYNLGIEIDSDDVFLQENLRGATKTTTGKIKHVSNKIDRTIDNVGDTVIDGGRKKEILKVRQEIMRGRKSFSHLFKIALATAGIATGVLPSFGIPALVAYLIRHKKIKDKERRELLAELKSELEIVNEKIKDAESDNDRKKKYEYIRLRREIQRGIEQIRFNQKINLQRNSNIKL